MTELRSRYPLSVLLKIAGLKRSSYYYHLKKKDADVKNDDIMNAIIRILYENKSRYGFRRITMALKKEGILVNHKKVLRLMHKMGLVPLRSRKRKYSSYKGTISPAADNIVNRHFEAKSPDQIWFTDITEFNLRGEKCYLSPIMDTCGREIIAYDVSQSPDLKQIKRMMEQALKGKDDLEGLVFHSDQGWQYQHPLFRKTLEEHKIRQSMSRKGTCLDNSVMENFFGLMKTEMFYGQEDNYKSIDDLIRGIDDYIDYYNNRRIKITLKGLTPVEYRNQSKKTVSCV